MPEKESKNFHIEVNEENFADCLETMIDFVTKKAEEDEQKIEEIQVQDESERQLQQEITESTWWITRQLKKIGNFIKEKGKIVWSAVKSICQSICSYVKELATSVLNGLKHVLSCVGSFFSDCFS